MDKKRPESLKELNTIGKTGKISILFIIGFAIISLIAVKASVVLNQHLTVLKRSPLSLYLLDSYPSLKFEL